MEAGRNFAVFPGDFQYINMDDFYKADDAGAALRYYSCNSSSKYAQTQNWYKQKIQPDVDKRCTDHCIQRRFSIAQRAQDRCCQVKSHHSWNSPEHRTHIKHRVRPDSIRSMQHPQHPSGKQLSACQKNECADG